MDENGMVIDLELAKLILIELFSTREYSGSNYDEYFKELYKKIESELIYNGDYFTFEHSNGHTYFGGPEGACGYWIQEVEEWIKEWKHYLSLKDLYSELNNENTVFYPVDGEIKCFVIHEGD